MTMVKSHTRKKYAKTVDSTVAQELTEVTDYLKKWTNRELGKIQHEERTPICIPVKNGYRIGSYKLTVNPNKTCDINDAHDTLIHRFENKISAILYAIYTIKRKYWIADKILQFNQEINKNYTDMLYYRRALELARQRKDYVSADVKQNRLEIAERRLTLAREQILQIHRTAKFNKVWE
jgi:hypothetical protein